MDCGVSAGPQLFLFLHAENFLRVVRDWEEFHQIEVTYQWCCEIAK